MSSDENKLFSTTPLFTRDQLNYLRLSLEKSDPIRSCLESLGFDYKYSKEVIASLLHFSKQTNIPDLIMITLLYQLVDLLFLSPPNYVPEEISDIFRIFSNATTDNLRGLVYAFAEIILTALASTSSFVWTDECMQCIIDYVITSIDIPPSFITKVISLSKVLTQKQGFQQTKLVLHMLPDFIMQNQLTQDNVIDINTIILKYLLNFNYDAMRVISILYAKTEDKMVICSITTLAEQFYNAIPILRPEKAETPISNKVATADIRVPTKPLFSKFDALIPDSLLNDADDIYEKVPKNIKEIITYISKTILKSKDACIRSFLDQFNHTLFTEDFNLMAYIVFVQLVFEAKAESFYMNSIFNDIVFAKNETFFGKGHLAPLMNEARHHVFSHFVSLPELRNVLVDSVNTPILFAEHIARLYFFKDLVSLAQLFDVELTFLFIKAIVWTDGFDDIEFKEARQSLILLLNEAAYDPDICFFFLSTPITFKTICEATIILQPFQDLLKRFFLNSRQIPRFSHIPSTIDYFLNTSDSYQMLSINNHETSKYLSNYTIKTLFNVVCDVLEHNSKMWTVFDGLQNSFIKKTNSNETLTYLLTYLKFIDAPLTNKHIYSIYNIFKSLDFPKEHYFELLSVMAGSNVTESCQHFIIKRPLLIPLIFACFPSKQQQLIEMFKTNCQIHFLNLYQCSLGSLDYILAKLLQKEPFTYNGMEITPTCQSKPLLKQLITTFGSSSSMIQLTEQRQYTFANEILQSSLSFPHPFIKFTSDETFYTEIEIGDNLTFTAWLRIDETVRQSYKDTFWLLRLEENPNVSLSFGFDGTNFLAQFDSNGLRTVVNLITHPLPDKWCFIGVRFPDMSTQSSIQTFLNGEILPLSELSEVSFEAPLKLSLCGSTNPEEFKAIGLIGQFQLFNESISENDIKRMYYKQPTSVKPLFTLPNSTLGLPVADLCSHTIFSQLLKDLYNPSDFLTVMQIIRCVLKYWNNRKSEIEFTRHTIVYLKSQPTLDINTYYSCYSFLDSLQFAVTRQAFLREIVFNFDIWFKCPDADSVLNHWLTVGSKYFPENEFLTYFIKVYTRLFDVPNNLNYQKTFYLILQTSARLNLTFDSVISLILNTITVHSEELISEYLDIIIENINTINLLDVKNDYIFRLTSIFKRRNHTLSMKCFIVLSYLINFQDEQNVNILIEMITENVDELFAVVINFPKYTSLLCATSFFLSSTEKRSTIESISHMILDKMQPNWYFWPILLLSQLTNQQPLIEFLSINTQSTEDFIHIICLLKVISCFVERSKITLDTIAEYFLYFTDCIRVPGNIIFERALLFFLFDFEYAPFHAPLAKEMGIDFIEVKHKKRFIKTFGDVYQFIKQMVFPLMNFSLKITEQNTLMASKFFDILKLLKDVEMNEINLLVFSIAHTTQKRRPMDPLIEKLARKDILVFQKDCMLLFKSILATFNEFEEQPIPEPSEYTSIGEPLEYKLIRSDIESQLSCLIFKRIKSVKHNISRKGNTIFRRNGDSQYCYYQHLKDGFLLVFEDHTKRIYFSKIRQVYYKPNALEIICLDTSFELDFSHATPPIVPRIHFPKHVKIIAYQSIKEFQQMLLEHQISAFQYLVHVNIVHGNSFHNPEKPLVFPEIIRKEIPMDHFCYPESINGDRFEYVCLNRSELEHVDVHEFARKQFKVTKPTPNEAKKTKKNIYLKPISLDMQKVYFFFYNVEFTVYAVFAGDKLVFISVSKNGVFIVDSIDFILSDSQEVSIGKYVYVSEPLSTEIKVFLPGSSHVIHLPFHSHLQPSPTGALFFCDSPSTITSYHSNILTTLIQSDAPIECFTISDTTRLIVYATSDEYIHFCSAKNGRENMKVKRKSALCNSLFVTNEWGLVCAATNEEILILSPNGEEMTRIKQKIMCYATICDELYVIFIENDSLVVENPITKERLKPILLPRKVKKVFYNRKNRNITVFYTDGSISIHTISTDCLHSR